MECPVVHWLAPLQVQVFHFSKEYGKININLNFRGDIDLESRIYVWCEKMHLPCRFCYNMSQEGCDWKEDDYTLCPNGTISVPDIFREMTGRQLLDVWKGIHEWKRGCNRLDGLTKFMVDVAESGARYDDCHRSAINCLESRMADETANRYFRTHTMEGVAPAFRSVGTGCDCCEGDEALLSQNGVNIFVDTTGKLDVFLKDSLEPVASGRIARCPNCGRQFG